MENINDLEFTGERFVPGIDDVELEVEHYQRYNAVVQLVKNKVVVDAACGEGYGSNILAQVADKVIGIDISKEAIDHARIKYKDQHNIEFVQESIADMSIPENSVDVFVSFETLEHIPEDLQKKFLSNVSKVLKPNGILVISTPNKKVYSDDRHYHNEFHVHEFYHDEFIDFLSAEFKYYKIYHQLFEISSILDCEGSTSRRVLYKRNPKNQLNGKYYIAIASNRSIEDVELGYVFLNNNDELRKKISRIIQLQNEEEGRNEHIKFLDKEIEEKNLYITSLQSEIEEKNLYITSLQSEVEDRNSFISSMEKKHQEEINEKDNAISSLTKQYSDEIETLRKDLSKQKELVGKLFDEKQKIKQEQDELRENSFSKEYVEDLKHSINDKNAHIEMLLEVEREWEREKGTRAYKKIVKRRARRDRIFPKNSKRRFVLDVVYKCVTDPKTMAKIITPHKIKTFFKVLHRDGMGTVNGIFNENVAVAAAKAHPESNEILAGLENIEEKGSIDEYEKLYFAKWNSPTVSIVIPVYNEFDYTYNCLKSILINSGEVKYEVIIADDCSTDFTREIDKIAENIRLITTKENCRFLLNCNNAAKYARGKYILFLNNDTQVRANWLQPLINLIESDEKIGMVGSKLIYPDGALQEAGGILWKDGSAWNYGHRGDAEASEFNYVKETDYISGAAIMIKADLWREIGGFDELFVPAYCEDSDLAFEVRKHGYKVMYQPKSVVVHFEGVSNGTDVNSGLKSYQVENSKKFYNKWKEVLESEHFDNGVNVFQARDKSARKKCVLFIDHYVPEYDKDAGSRTILQYVKLLIEKGFVVKFIPDNFYRREPYTTTLQELGVEVLYGPEYYNNWKQWIKENAAYIDYVWMNRPHISIKYIDVIKEVTNAKVIYYGSDLHFLRLEREYEITKEKSLLDDIKACKEQELYIVERADVSYYPSNVEIDRLKAINKDFNAKRFDIFVYDKFRDDIPDNFNVRKDICFVGGFVHDPNRDAVKWFVNEILPLIRKKIDVKFYVVGSNPSQDIINLASDDVVIKGFVSDDELKEIYDNCRLTVIPLRFGAGVKGKVIEAIYNGLPIATTSIGVEGIPEVENLIDARDSAEAFAELVCNMYSDAELLSTKSIAYQEYAKKYLSVSAIWDNVKEDFDM